MTEPVQLGVAQTEPVAVVVETLEEWLKDAKSGELRGLMLVGQITGDRTRRAYAGDYTYPEMSHSCLLGIFDLIEAAKEGDSPVERDE
jgi:hypothetical protein